LWPNGVYSLILCLILLFRVFGFFW
jgi:hypothetical protein